MTKTLLFDLGNVVLTNDHAFHSPEQLTKFCQYFKVTLADYIIPGHGKVFKSLK